MFDSRGNTLRTNILVASEPSEHPTELPYSTPIVRFISKPSYLLLSIAITIFVVETTIMLLLVFLPPLSVYKEAFIDASLLTSTVFPVLYFLVFKPLRIHIALRQQSEAEKDVLIIELQKALDEVKMLQGFIPICASCKKIRDDKGCWHQMEEYVSTHSDVVFSHGLCPECAKKLYPEFVEDK